ncbi:hypothetical protein A2954_05870 [Candidatus Roizmanbacteria bacterium RIFCSPLOWO2_01_FULL_37_12]|uniref:Histidine kinase N-terminal 7TM region domain-containing protein n=1 Tax=Candidatus Roizmanbacteria bacterium RIFCSPLOWO2_01_FULL_37_12 TaxID=1802056 RepID=A0A1F7IBU5_9BACT|nr:MAG: hypothetical protein A2768_02610 [Candidatus Roizmanbacteria bacterium RIFCSPHIGHO2_01_FULL_37_16]OGK25996.1 MAG: hypothetical protein A3D76_03485 [Candidatus Roizmanbacteria bacterium RIFCSPHIGHO2_02_FULL_37_9b]OGK40833.1 MAG: hypothetical protein A2954_05870 [Candidatus Roizmanbacteria bacterium RIFCSPLOWO2_01_FULL_37_12]
MINTIINHKATYWILFLYSVVFIWWVKLQYNGVGTSEAYIFNWFYGLIGLSGGIYGIKISVKKWGGWKSIIGKGLILLSIGLLGQWFGLQVWTYYNVFAKIEVPYPSLADIGYFALIPAYTLAAWMFTHASGAKFSLRTKSGKLYALLIPLVSLTLAYAIFLKDIGFNLSNPIKLFLDIGYPLGEMLPVSIAAFTLTLSKRLLGGTMKSRIIFLIGAFFFQFLTEYAFLYTAGIETYINGGWNDLMYATSYTIMSLALIAFNDYK